MWSLETTSPDHSPPEQGHRTRVVSGVVLGCYAVTAPRDAAGRPHRPSQNG